jgi:hypothetical protein
VTEVAGFWSWSAPLHRSRCGASHQRRGVPCQDASLSTSLHSADGLPVGLMAVADGHGGSRYWLSDVGSRLACELAIQLASQDLAQQHLGGGRPDQLQVVQRWLAEKLPGRIVAAWQEAIQADWQGRELPPPHQDEPFSSQSYGSTLALVVLTPHWWGHTGLGDWDLVLLSNHQPDRILSQEADQGLQGEATESLCLASASRCFAARTAVYSLTEEQRQACGLVLTTDGVRKSCAADDDHLALSRFLLEEAQPCQTIAAGSTERLDSSLDRISRDGSGDDVSVALACFGDLRAVAAVAAAERSAPSPLPEPARTSSSPHGNSPSTRPPAGTLLLAVILLASGGIAALAGFHLLQPRIWPLSTAQQQGLHQQSERLCRQPKLIEATLKARKTQFSRLRTNPAELNRLLTQKDWLGALISLSQPEGQGLGPVQMCSELTLALRQHWRNHLNPDPSTAGHDDGLRSGQRDPSRPRPAAPDNGPGSGSADR